jgi:hypothetical protein
MRRVVTWHIQAGIEQRLWKSRQISQLWNRMIFLQTISIIRKCYPSLFVCTFPLYSFAYYINFPTFVIQENPPCNTLEKHIHFCLFVYNDS